MPAHITPAPKSLLSTLYLDDFLSFHDIGIKLGVSEATVSDWCRNYGIVVRSASARAKSRYVHYSNPKKGHSKGVFAFGYRLVLISPDSPYYAMARKNTSNEKRYIGPPNRYVLEHRLVMAEKLGRCLSALEHVHHINGDITDNRPENLELLSPGSHSIKSQSCSRCALRKEVRLLRWQIKELQTALQEKLRLA